jgi:tetratricopeptide (TPR) repeat protein
MTFNASRCTALRFPVVFAVAFFVGSPIAASGPTAARPDDQQIATLERAVTSTPEDLRVCAEYRQRMIALGDYDRSIKLLERLSDRPGAGPNVHMSLALAYVDKVPAASPFKRIFLGRDAMRALSQAIEREPSLVAYYIRGLIALYYPEAVFHRARSGVADLERARSLLATLPRQPYQARVYVSLGDGYWKLKDLTHAVSIWTDGVNRFPADQALRSRVAARGADLDRLVEHALDPATRVDTSLHELFPATASP